MAASDNWSGTWVGSPLICKGLKNVCHNFTIKRQLTKSLGWTSDYLRVMTSKDLLGPQDRLYKNTCKFAFCSLFYALFPFVAYSDYLFSFMLLKSIWRQTDMKTEDSGQWITVAKCLIVILLISHNTKTMPLVDHVIVIQVFTGHNDTAQQNILVSVFICIKSNSWWRPLVDLTYR